MESPTEDSLENLRLHLGERWNNILDARSFAKNKLEQLTNDSKGIATADTSLVAFGSLARKELTAESDLDWALLIDGQYGPAHLESTRLAAEAVKKAGLKEPGGEGTFGGPVFSHDLIHHIGGGQDDNANTTCRMLLLLESAPVGRRDAYDRTVRNVIDRYIREDFGWLNKHDPLTVPRFLFNDFARFWRTMAVDFAYKRRSRGGEGWALRTAKLRMSRKLLFVSGIVMCYSCALNPDIASLQSDHSNEDAVAGLTDYLSRFVGVSPLAIIANLLLKYPELDDPARKLFGSYNAFMELLGDPTKRKQLQEMEILDASNSAVYDDIRTLGSDFQNALDEIFLSGKNSELTDLTMRYGVF